MSKTNFIDGDPGQGIQGTRVMAQFLNQQNYAVPTGEDLDGSAPVLYGVDTGAADAYVVNFVFGKKRREGTNTSTSTNKLIDSGASFQTAGVVIGDVVLNVTNRTSATVVTIDSQTQLTLSADIFTATPKAYAVGPNIQQLPQSYIAGMQIAFKAVNANTGASTVNVNGLGVKTIKKNSSADLFVGDIAAGQIIGVVYDGTNMQLISPPSTAQFTSEASNSAVVASVSLDLGTVVVGARYLIYCLAVYTSGNAAGMDRWKLYKSSGTAGVNFYVNVPQPSMSTYHGVSDIGTVAHTSAILQITAGGTLVMNFINTYLTGTGAASFVTQIYAVRVK